MGITHSTDKGLNWFLYDRKEENSGISTWVYTSTGNEKRKKGLPVYNDTYTLSTTSNQYQMADVNAKLIDWDHGVTKKGSELVESPGIFTDANIVADKEYFVFGHPDKWVYDYQQDYSNCGVDSSLNVLAMAGVKDIIEVNSSYQSYLSTPTITSKKQVVWDAEDGTWKTETVTTTTYPKSPIETEDSFLLWAVQNSPNDTQWYKDNYTDNIPIEGDIPILGDEDIDDYVVHSKNFDDYSTVEDLQDAPLEVGGTTVFHRDNILNYWGVESTAAGMQVNYLSHVSTEPIIETPTPVDNGDGTTTKIKITTQYDELGRKKTVTTEEIILRTGTNPDEMDSWEELKTTVTVEVTYEKNIDFFNFLGNITSLVANGQGAILAGFANTFLGGKGGSHAISLVGVVQDPEKVVKETTIKITTPDGYEKEDSSTETTSDIIGVYVVDTGGFLTDGLQTEQAQFIDIISLYNFLTNATYDVEDQEYMISNVNYTNENIRAWADNLNLVGNNRKNLLEGNRSQNSIWGGKGNDIIWGNDGDDYLYGDQDQDTIYGGAGNDVMTGGAGNDTYIFNSEDFSADLATTNIDTAKGYHDYLIVGSGKDNLQFDSNDSVKFTRIEDMQYQNRDGNLVIEYSIQSGSSYNNCSITVQDYFKKQLYSSILYVIESDNNSLYNEFNFVQEILSRGYIDYFSYAEKNNTLKGSKFMDSIIGGNKNDSINGGGADDIINGGGSNDTIKAGTGNDTIYGSYGNDKLYGESGNDTFKYQTAVLAGEEDKDFAGGAFGGHDTIYSGSGTDVIELLEYKREDLTFTKAKNDLVITYDKEKGSSITIASYFSKKGKTSIYELRLNNGDDVIGLRSDYQNILATAIKEKNADGSINYDAYNYIKGTKGNDSISGGLGNDTLYGGNGDDTLNGGIGSDKLYGQAGNNTYVFDSKALGEDTIYVSGKGKSTLDFTGSGINFNSIGSTDAINEYSFTKYKNDLIINYATEADLSDSDNALIKISNFFKSSGAFEILNADGTTLNIKENATIYMNGNDLDKNKITGSNYNDLIIGYEFKDTLNGGKGNDTIIGGKGNDSITGGAGTNIIQYAKGDGMDTITLTKGENLSIQLSGFDINTATDAKTKIFDYNIVKNNLVISYIDGNGKSTDILTLKNFGTKDVTTSSGSVKLYNNGVEIMDLREGNYLDKYINFTPKKYSYTGKWQSEVIDTRALNAEVVKNNKGAKVNAKAGNDTIYGSDYNDTIDGGDGDDVIYASYGKNTVNGGKGSDTYHIFADTTNANLRETTTIKDSGKVTDGTDTANIYVDDLSNLQTVEGKYSQQGSIWFNIKATGKQPTVTFNITDAKGNQATLTGVENIVIKDANKDASGNITSYTSYTYNYNQLVGAVTSWLTENKYKDVSSVMKGDSPTDKNELLAIFTDSQYFTQQA